MFKKIASALALAGAGGLAALLGFFAFSPSMLIPSAQASVIPNCFAYSSGDDYGSMAVDEIGGGQVIHSGIRTGVLVGNSANCQRINSVYANSSNRASLAEFGYAIGWIACFHNPPYDTFEWHTEPTLFAVGLDAANNRYCSIWSTTHPISGQTDSFRESDKNMNTYWGGWWKGIEMQPSGMNLDFSQGRIGVNAERASSGDNMHAVFNNLEELINGTWSDTDNLGAFYNTDPVYVWQVPNQQTAKIVEGP